MRKISAQRVIGTLVLLLFAALVLLPLFWLGVSAFKSDADAESSSAWIFRSIGLERSRLKIPIIDFASITYLPDTRWNGGDGISVAHPYL